MAAAEAFSDDASHLSTMLTDMVDDVARASRERLEIFPVCHHSPASAVHMVRRLKERPPKLILMEGCEDMTAALPLLRDCTLPVALQAFAHEGSAFPEAWSPLSVVMPLTEFSAEFQAIAFALNTPGCEIIFVDRSADHIFQWMPKEDDALKEALRRKGEDGDDEEPDLPALGVEVGRLEPTMAEFMEVLLANARVRHFQEWWSQYVEQAVLGADYKTYRQVMFLVASLLRRLGRSDADRASDERREAYMWTRMKQALSERGIAPEDALHICGAVHAVSQVPEFGVDNDTVADIEPFSDAKWLHGMLPSSFTAIERQFGHPHGTITLAESTWRKACGALQLSPFVLSKKAPKSKRRQKSLLPPPDLGPDDGDRLIQWLSSPPALERADDDQLLRWCVDVVQLARKNGYLASTADSIAIYEHAILLARMRNRRHPTPYDFKDAAVTCLEKSRVPKKRDIRRICEILLGGEREGTVGYSSLPPLAQDVIDRLAPVGVVAKSSRIKRAMFDLQANPELTPCSDLLWRVHYLLGPNKAVEPIIGERRLGQARGQESWDIRMGKREGQQAIIPLAYEGVTVEQVLEKRLKRTTFDERAGAVAALEAAEACELYMSDPRLGEELGRHAVLKMEDEESAENAPEIFDRARRLVQFHRSQPEGIPPWLGDFVTTGYRHYAALLPQAFEDQGTHPKQVAGMLSFLFNLESLALSLGCDRGQVMIALEQAGTVASTPEKLGLLWAAEWLVNKRDRASIREFFDASLDNPMMLPAFPGYVAGFLLALGFAPAVAPLVVEALSKAFGRLPPALLMPWLPGLIMTMREYGGSKMAPVIKEAARTFPAKLDALDGWSPPWERALPADTAEAAAGPSLELSPVEAGARDLLFANREAAASLARRVGATGEWFASLPSGAAGPTGPALSDEEAAARRLLFAHKSAADTLAARIGASGEWVESTSPAGPAAAAGRASLSPEVAGAAALMAEHPAAADALAARIAGA